MLQLFARAGISFKYPGNWEFETEESDDGWTVSIQSPNTAFFILSVDFNEDDATQLAEQALQAMQESYSNIELKSVVTTIAGSPATGYDIHFFAFDLTSNCAIRGVTCTLGSMLIMSQCADCDLEESGPVLQAVMDSIKIEDDEIEP